VDDRRKKFGRQFLQALPYARALKLELVDFDGGVVEIRLPYSDELIGDPDSRVIHGGAVSALMDTCAGAAVMSHPSVPTGTATLNLRIDYMRPATPGQAICARAECYHVTKSIAFVRATAMDDDRDRPVATATGAFTVAART